MFFKKEIKSVLIALLSSIHPLNLKCMIKVIYKILLDIIRLLMWEFIYIVGAAFHCSDIPQSVSMAKALSDVIVLSPAT